MPPFLLRLAYVAEFLVAILTVLTLWAQVGGQDHLDLMPWYTKLILTLTMSLVITMATASAVAHERAWNAKTLASVALVALIALLMAGVTYYYHLHESDDEPGDDGPTAHGLAPSGRLALVPARAAGSVPGHE